MVALLAKKKSSKSADTNVAHARKADVNTGSVRNIAKQRIVLERKSAIGLEKKVSTA